jgi:Erv1 / Alr family
MTLHSVASLYPNTPTEAERLLMVKWLDLFRDTITCPSCQGHFAELLASYRAQFPNMLYSRRDFLLFTFRAHNSVNKRIGKPVYGTVQECFDLLRKNVQFNKAQSFRITYTNHITRHWRTFQDASGMSAMKKINEIKKIEMQYMAPRSNEFEEIISEDNLIFSTGVQEQARPMFVSRNVPRLVMTASGMRIRR